MDSAEHVVTTLARQRAPWCVGLRPDGIAGLVYDAICGLPTPPDFSVIAHWTGLPVEQVKKAIDRLRQRRLIEGAGLVPTHNASRMTYQPIRPAGA